ncbi:MFS transporter [Mycobacterium gordonae]|nr:MFS transporter [Mycobacterium gordonae]MCV7005363.1 MFS transporter [Mycobacterium gordonae]
MLGVSLTATLSATVFVKGIAFLIPVLDHEHDISLAGAALLSAMPGAGMLLTHIGWGYLLDRVGERRVLSAGLALTACSAYGAAIVPPPILAQGMCLFVGGMSAASAYTASGPLVTGWFPPNQRGLAMGIRQTAPPLGVALAAFVLPELGESSFSSALIFCATLCGSAALICAVTVRDSSRPELADITHYDGVSPYRGTSVLWRIHLSSALLMVPQTVVFTFMLVWLIEAHDWSVPAAGALVSLSQLLGAIGRIVVGRWSDRLGSRTAPIRRIAAAAALVLLSMAIMDQLRWPFAIGLMVAASVITVLDNGLAFTAIAEIAGRYWSGRAMATQNTTQTVAAAAGAPLFGEVIELAGYPLGFAICGVLPLLALPMVPMHTPLDQRVTPSSPSDSRSHRPDLDPQAA